MFFCGKHRVLSFLRRELAGCAGESHLVVVRKPKKGRCLGHPPSLSFDHEFNSNVLGRNCDRAVQRSTALEQINEASALLLAYAFHPKTQVHGVEERNVFTRLAPAVHGATDIDGNSRERDAL